MLLHKKEEGKAFSEIVHGDFQTYIHNKLATIKTNGLYQNSVNKEMDAIYLDYVEVEKAYKEVRARVKELPKDYQKVFEEIRKYLRKRSQGAEFLTWEMQIHLAEMFEEHASQQHPVLKIIGNDVGAFVEELYNETAYSLNQDSQTLNEEIWKKLDK